jgi:mannose-1-phosphate guanylyltransferase
MFDNYFAVIMAGGSGTRLWPLSRQARPKQTLQIGRPESLFQLAVQRLEGLFPPERILVVTIAEQAQLFQQQVPAIPAENYLLEPLPRGTASVVGLAAVAIHQRNPHACMAILTADHFIGNAERFRLLLQTGYEVAQNNYLVTLGITPTYPATGYGYIQFGQSIGQFEGADVFQALKFKEKPSEELAANFIAGGDHAWNSGMFIWQVQDILEEFALQMPALSSQLQVIAEAWDTPQREAVLQQVWPQVKAQTIDYGIMEGARRVAVIPAAGLEWNDVGSWESLFEVLPADEHGNIVQARQVLSIDSSGTLVYAENSDRLIVTIGTDDLIVVDTGDVIMVCSRSQAQKVKEAVSQLKANKPAFI